jgi:hypothetical protein
MPTDAERELRSGRYKGVPVPSSYQPVDDPRNAERLRGFREGVDAALDTVQDSTDRAVRSMRHQGPLDPSAVAAVAQVPLRPCRLVGDHGSHYWARGASGAGTAYCPGSPS